MKAPSAAASAAACSECARLRAQLEAAARVYGDGVAALEARVAAVEGARRELQRDAEILAREVVRLLVMAGRGGSA